MVNDTIIGRNIRDKLFKGNPYAQLSLIRKSIWALAVLNENIESTEEEKQQAEEIIEISRLKDVEIQKILDESYPKETEELNELFEN